MSLSKIGNQFKMGNKVEIDNMGNPLFYDILPGDLYFLFPFQTPNNIIDRKMSENNKFVRTNVALLPS